MRYVKLKNRCKLWLKKPRRFLLRFDFLRTRTDFVLRISSLSKHHKSRFAGSYYPPPGYGVPPGKNTPEDGHETKHQYGLYLMTGKVRLWLIAYALMAAFMLLPTIGFDKPIGSKKEYFSVGHWSIFFASEGEGAKKIFGISLKKPMFCHSANGQEGTCLENYLFYFLLFTGFSYGFYRVVYYFMPPVLNDVWRLWPLTAYRQFLSVPHLIELKAKDKVKTADKDLHIFWRPDKQAWRARQSTEYAKGSKSLQEVILDMAFFEMFFNKKNHQKNGMSVTKSPQTINVNHAFWFLLSPVWGNYLFLLISAIFFLVFYSQHADVDSMVLKYPYAFIPALICWFLISIMYMTKLFKDLNEMRGKIASGYYQSHFDLVPQQILGALTDIPTSRQIQLAIKQLRVMLNVMGGVAVVVFLAMLEVIGGGIPGA
ncbi:MAG: Unknown protein [uncultured Thiotrichaceae bacterium]|uniref:Uncharacterized protein n=1 Tax=uncultured Thiotrichaceae bacterium TaxID=298394 RepID=A0A6S6UIJ2_9GAMM|nr:MAG: Unknown protein [uncultured Thiotrichaceae bacterium]